ncbi:NYN domain-containing protein [Paucibacter soli]|uniref:NYN domain-containing protein n=1 Tax=Paucibacter soli TaxID=3133433 RepID=UPI0030959BEC
MFNRQFMDLVRHQLIRVLAKQARSARDQKPSEPALRYTEEDVAVFVDLQNLHYFLKENCRVAATQVHIPNLLRDFAAVHRMDLREIHVVTGIHDPRREPQKHEAMVKRLRWLERNGVKVTALPLSYYKDHSTQEVRVQEKGVDVRIASEILRAVNDGLTRAIVASQDKDIGEALVVAQDMARERGRKFTAFTMALEDTTWEHNGKCGMNGLRGTVRLPIGVDLVKRHVRPDRAPAEREQRSDLASSGVQNQQSAGA